MVSVGVPVKKNGLLALNGYHNGDGQKKPLVTFAQCRGSDLLGFFGRGAEIIGSHIIAGEGIASIKVKRRHPETGFTQTLKIERLDPDKPPVISQVR